MVEVNIHQEREGIWAEVPDRQGCYAQGETFQEVIKNLHEVIDLWDADYWTY